MANLGVANRLSSTTHTIALVVYGIQREEFMRYSFCQDMLVGAESEAKAFGKHLLFACVEDLANGAIEELLHKTDGLLFKGVVSQKDLREIATLKPVVLLTTSITGGGVSEVSDDGYAGIFAATSHLIEKGHRRIAFLWRAPDDPRNERCVQRYQGYCEALATHGIEIPPAYQALPNSAEFPRIASDPWDIVLKLEPRPTALVCIGDQGAAFVIATAQEHGVRIPDDFSVTGYDEAAEVLHLQPPLTTMAVPYGEIAHQATRLLCEEIVKPDSPKQIIRLQPILREKGSVAAPPARLQEQK